MRITTQYIARKYNLQMAGQDLKISNLAKLDYHLDGVLSFAETEEYLRIGLSNPNICALITKKELVRQDVGKTLLFTDNPRYVFYSIHNDLVNETDFYRSRSNTVISKSAKIDRSATISDHNVYIGNNVVIGPNVSILENVHINDGVIIQAGTAIGLEGHECFRIEDSVLSVLHGGGVVIGRNVSIGSTCTIDKGLFRENTFIGKDTKIDHMVHIGHGANINERVFVAANSGIGRCRIDSDVYIGFAATILPGISIGSDASVSIGAVVTKNVAKGEQVTGNFAIEHSKFLKFLRSIR